jgi:hypothetical protein
MRRRDARAILFCVTTTMVVLVISYLAFLSYIVSLALTGAWAAFVLTRPRMQRVFRRLRGEPDWSGYFEN